MQIASVAPRIPHLVQALEALAQQADKAQESAAILLEELSGITVLVAQKFTNDRTADGLLEAFYLTVGCVSLGMSQANLPDSAEAKLNFLQQHGAEYVFQMGFRQIKELSSLPYVAFVSDFDQDAFVQQRNVKALFSEICRADPTQSWTGDQVFQRELVDRQAHKNAIDCAKWLRRHHYNGPIKDVDLDAHAVIAIAIIFAILADGRIVARTGQKEIEAMLKRVRENQPEVEIGWQRLLNKIPVEYQALMRERMDAYQKTIIAKILSKKVKAKAVITEIQDGYASSEVEIDYP